MEVQDLWVFEIRPNTTFENDRKQFDAVALAELAESIKDHGLAQPITVRKTPMVAICPHCYTQPTEKASGDWICSEHGLLAEVWYTEYEIVAGERRWRAHLVAGLSTVKAIVRELTDEEAADIMLLENVDRVDISEFEEARAYQKRMDLFGWDIPTVAGRAKKTKQHVIKRLRLLRLIPDIERLVTGGSLPLNRAELLCTLTEKEQREVVSAIAQREGIPSIEAVRKMVNAIVEQRSQMAMFDLASFAAEQLTAAEQKTNQPKLRRHPKMPSLDKVGGSGTIGKLLLEYAALTKDAGLDVESTVIETVVDEMIKRGWTRL